MQSFGADGKAGSNACAIDQRDLFDAEMGGMRTALIHRLSWVRFDIGEISEIAIDRLSVTAATLYPLTQRRGAALLLCRRRGNGAGLLIEKHQPFEYAIEI